MARAKKIAITVDAELLTRVERLRGATAESRSAVFARGLRLLLGEEERAARVAAYVEGYRRVPETDLEWVNGLSIRSLTGLPWEPEE